MYVASGDLSSISWTGATTFRWLWIVAQPCSSLFTSPTRGGTQAPIMPVSPTSIHCEREGTDQHQQTGLKIYTEGDPAQTTFILSSEMTVLLLETLNRMLPLLICQEAGSSPGHISVLHLWIWESDPPQALPPWEGRGLSHVRYRRICPPPHDLLHVPQPLQGLQLPWATTQNRWKSAEQ